jgi:hypothetical protein
MLDRLTLCRAHFQATAAPGTVNSGLVDWFSLVHAGVGLLFGVVGLRLGPMLLMAVGWEVFEHLLKDCAPFAFVHPSQDTLRNATSDVVVTLAAWLLARRVRAASARRRSSGGAGGARSRRGGGAIVLPRAGTSVATFRREED